MLALLPDVSLPMVMVRRVMILGYGGIAYVAFLGVFVYTIGFIANAVVPKGIDEGSSGSIAPAVVVDASLLGLFAAQHSIMARPWFKRWWTRFVPTSIERSTFVLAATLVLALVLWQWRALPAAVWSVEGTWVRATLLGLYALGWLIVLGSTFLIDHFDLFGLRQVVARARGRSLQPPELRQPLLYRRVRHPIMVGFVIAFWATPDMSAGRMLFAALATGYIVVAVRFEERDLVAHPWRSLRTVREAGAPVRPTTGAGPTSWRRRRGGEARNPGGEKVKDPRTIVLRIEQDPRLPHGRAERFHGYAVLGVPFASRHVLAMRRFPASSVGPGYTSVWHRNSDGEWTMWVDSEPLHACPRYFGNGVERVVRVPIDVSWPDPRRMILKIEQGRELDWEIMLASTLTTRFLSAVGHATPDVLWRRPSVLSVMAAVAGPVLGAGRLSLHGNAPNGQWFKANPQSIWAVIGGRAVLDGADLGTSEPLPEAAWLGDFVIPQRGIFAIGQALFEPFAEDRHVAAASRKPTGFPRSYP